MLALDSTSSSVGSLASAASQAGSVKDSYLDQNSLNSVKVMGHHDNPKALKEISKKFEAMFVQQMLKSMRDANAVFEDGDMFSSEEVKFHQEMLDQQMVLNLTSGEGMGLAKSMYQQMLKSYGKNGQDNQGTDEKSIQPLSMPGSLPANLKPFDNTRNKNTQQPPALISRAGIKSSVAQTPDEFIAKVKPYAEKAAAELNINPDVLLAQAALETGWGKHLIHDNQGANSFNIFNIKASGNWQGKSVGINSLEYKQGIAQQERSEFRKYDNYLQSFADYVKLIKNNPRYEDALSADDSAGYADALQKAGYATDPEYAEKIKRILESDSIRSAVNTTSAQTQTLAADGGQS